MSKKLFTFNDLDLDAKQAAAREYRRGFNSTREFKCEYMDLDTALEILSDNSGQGELFNIDGKLINQDKIELKTKKLFKKIG